MDNCSPISTPIITEEASLPHDNDPIDAFTFRRIVGALQYLTFTHPDIVYAVNKVFQQLNSLIFAHFRAVKQILRYIKGTQNLILLYLCHSPLTLYGFFDSD